MGRHAFANAWLSGMQGQNMFSGALTGGASSLGGAGLTSLNIENVGLLTAGNAVLGGTVSVIGGGKFANGAVTGAYTMLFNHLVHKKAAWDGNGDGKLQKSEADSHYLNGNGKPITVDGNKIDLTGLDENGMTYDSQKNIYSLATLKAFMELPYETASTYGGSLFKLVNGSWQMLSQPYHYDMRTWSGVENIGRNILTIMGDPSLTIRPSQMNVIGGQVTQSGKRYFINIKY